MENLVATIRNLLDDSFDGTLAADELLPRIELKLSERVTESDLIKLWRNGDLYVSRVGLLLDGYVPTSNCKWTTERLGDYFGFDEKLGVYQISDTLFNPLSITLEASISLENPPISLVISSDKEQVAVGDRQGVISIGSIKDGKITRILKSVRSPIWALAYSPDGNLLASGHENGHIILWNRDGQQVSEHSTNDDYVKSLSFSPDGKQLLSSHECDDSERPLVRLWSVNPLRHTASFFHHKKAVWRVKFLPSGTGFVSAGTERNVLCIVFGNDTPRFETQKQTGTITDLVLHPKGGVVASGAWSGVIKIWDLSGGAKLRSIEAHTSRIICLAFSASGQLLASGGKDSQIALWEMPNCTPVKRLNAHDGWVRGVAFATDNVFLTIGSEGLCKVWRPSYRFPTQRPQKTYNTAEDVLNDFRRVDEEDDE